MRDNVLPGHPRIQSLYLRESLGTEHSGTEHRTTHKSEFLRVVDGDSSCGILCYNHYKGAWMLHLLPQHIRRQLHFHLYSTPLSRLFRKAVVV